MAGEPPPPPPPALPTWPPGSYCAAAVDWAYEAGITSGASSTGFAPNSALTREQAVTLLCNYAKAQGLDVSAAADLSGYPDASAVSAFAQDAVAWAVDAGLLTGTGAGTLNPQGTATRAELAALLGAGRGPLHRRITSPINRWPGQQRCPGTVVFARRFVLCWGQETQRGIFMHNQNEAFLHLNDALPPTSPAAGIWGIWRGRSG